MRFAIWTAVSTETQAADDKDSLPNQEKRCRAVATAKGWQEIGKPYIVPGESRTRWVNLRDAENEIPPLHQMLEDAKGGLFDILVLYDYNRMRDLLDPVAKSLATYGVQIYSVNQPVEPLPPEQFSPYASDTSSMMQGMNQIISRWQINDLRRKHAYGVIARVRRGLHPSGTKPYGYTYHGPKVPLTVNPVQAAVALQIKELFLKGLSARQITDHLDEKHIPAPRARRWSINAVRNILTNPFYSGKVRLGLERRVNDPRTGYTRLVHADPSKILLADGQHQPLWDAVTHALILDEMKRRSHRYKGRKTHRFSNLLYCAEHNRPLHVRPNNGVYDPATLRWACRAIPGWWHVCVFDKDVLSKIGDELIRHAKDAQNAVKVTEPIDDTASLISARDDLLSRRERLTDALEQGALDPVTYASRTEGIDSQIAALQEKLGAAAGRLENRQHHVSVITAMLEVLKDAPEYFTQAPAQEVNTMLRDLIEKIMINEAGELECLFR